MSNEIIIEDALCFNLYSASRAMTQVYRPYLKKVGLTYPQFLVMHILWQNSKVKNTVKDIGKRLYLDSGTLTPLLKRLELLDFISRERSIHDEREVIISLTKNGIKLKSKCKEIPMEMFCNLNLTTQEFTDVRNSVRNVLSNLNRKLEKN